MSTESQTFESQSAIFVKNKQSKIFSFNGVLYKIALFLSVIFFGVSVSQALATPTLVLPLKADFSNLSETAPTSLKLDKVMDIGITLNTASGRSSTTYYYYLVRFGETKVIIETTSKSDLVSGNQINVTSDISSKTEDNLQNITTLADTKASGSDLKLSANEFNSIRVIKHFSGSDEFFAKYWGFVGFTIFFLATIAYYIKHKSYLKAELGKVAESQNAPFETTQTQNVNKFPSESGIGTESQNLGSENISSSNLNQNASAVAQSSAQTVVSPEPEYKPNSKPMVYVLLAVFLGIFGVHHFYNQKILYGFLHLIWVIALIAFFFSPENLSWLAIVAFVGFFVTLFASIIQALMRAFSRR